MKSNIARAIERRVGGWRSGTAGYAGSASTTAVRRIVASSIITFIVVITNVTLFAGVADAAPSVQSTTDIQAAPAAAAAAPSAVVTTGFQESVAFSGLTNPSSIHFANDGRVFITEKSGLILVYSSMTATKYTVFADLRPEVDDYWDRGLLSMALDPKFPTNPYVYVYYAFDAPIGGTAPTWNDACPTPPGPTTDGCVISGRLARLTADASTGYNTMVAGSEKVLINAWCQQFPSHSNDTVAVGPDGALYLTAGDGASFDNVDYGQYGNTYAGDPRNPCGDPPGGAGGAETAPTAEGGALRAQSMRRAAGEPILLNGSILRVDPATGASLPNNPNHASSNANAQRIDAYGLRNPFRFTFRPGTNEVWIGDVGWNTWEEINRITDPTAASKNFGWPCYEGPNPEAGYQSAGLNICNNLPQNAVATPYYSYKHSGHVVAGETCPTGSSAISGLAFYQGNSYPMAYHGALFFSDYARDCLWAMQLGSNGLPDPTKISVVVANAGHPVDLETGPGGDMFYVDMDDGQVRRIQAVGPNAVVTSDVTSGPVGVTIHFDGTTSTDSDPAATLTYAWDLDGDGNFNDSTSSKPSFTYSAEGKYTVRLKVSDSRGLSDISNPFLITVGPPPVPTITSPTSSLTWSVGDLINFSGSAVDGHGNTLPPSALTWSVLLHHCVGSLDDCHIHFLQTFNGVASGSFNAPDHEYPSYLELLLTATDPVSGLQTTTTVRLDPQTVTLTFQSTRSGAALSVDGFTGTTPLTYDVIKGSTNTIGAVAQQTLNGGSYLFTSWSDGGAQSHDVVVGTAPITYTALFTRTPVEASKVTLSDTSPVPPALWTAGQQPPTGAPAAVLSWLGTDQAHRLNIESSADGVTYTHKVTLTDTAVTTPSVLVVNSNVVMIAWIGTDKAHRINVMYDAYGARKKLTLSDTSPFAPSLTYFNGQVWLSWAGTDSKHSLNVLPLGPQGLTPGKKTTLSSFGSRAAPTLAADPAGNQLLLTWTPVSAPGNITLATSSNGSSWSLPDGQPSAQTSSTTPIVLALATKPTNGYTYYWVWAASGTHQLSLMHADNVAAWSATATFRETSTGGPAFGYPGPSGQLLLIWTGTDKAHHLNIATIQN